MNRKSLAVVFFLVIIVVGVISWQLAGNQSQNDSSGQLNRTATPSVFLERSELTDFIASFDIYTHGTKRIFTQAMYQNQSPDVFIQNPDPSIIYVKKAGITWADFFETLPFSLNKDCLVTGTKQTFCTTESERLRFYLNNAESPDALDMKIKPGDALRVTYGH